MADSPDKPPGDTQPHQRRRALEDHRRISRPSFMLELQEGSPVGEYEVQEQIGEGAMGTVYSAVHPLIGKRVAIKVLKPELCSNQAQIDRFVQEAQTVNRIGHPNIVDVFSLGELPDGRAYYVMEWLRGEDLKTRLARGPMAVADACDILDGIARALDAAHAKEIIHRDLKPDNVFLHQVDNGPLMVKLLDFGIAKLVRATPGMEKTQTGNMLGTPRYISPEQARGISIDYRADIYSLGVMAYEMLAGRPPFHGESAMDLVVQHLSSPAPALSQFAKIPRALEQCVMRMLEKDADRRPSLEEVRAVLVDPSRARLTPLPLRMRAPSRIKLWIAAGCALLVLGAAAVTWKLASHTSEPAPVAAQQPPQIAAPPVAAVAPPAAEQKTVPVAEPPARPAPPTRGTLAITVTGSKDAVILVDDREWGRGASIKIELDPGVHVVQVRPPGGSPVTRTIDVVGGETSAITVAVRGSRPVRNSNRVEKPPPPPPDDDGLLRPKGKR